jgi:two-component system, NtrC family, sensor kinase
MNGPSNTLRPEDYTVLVADDTLANLTLMRELLLSFGFTVLEAKDGFEAVALTRERLPDIVLLDVMMPDVDGLEVCRRLKADSRTAEIPVIFITALADSENIVPALKRVVPILSPNHTEVRKSLLASRRSCRWRA